MPGDAPVAKDWRGIVPLRSTRADVERFLGAPTTRSSFALYYNLHDELVVVRFQTVSCEKDRFGLSWNVPFGTVTRIGVIAKAKYLKERFIHGANFKTEDANAGFVYYTNHSEGLSVETLNGIVTIITYLPTEEQENLRCPRVQDCCWDYFPKLDEYTNLSFEEEKARLDNYAFLIKERLGRGVIVVYGRSRDERSNIMRRTERAKKYLTQRDGIEPQRILVVDGGYREYSGTELDLYPIGGEPDRIYVYPVRDPKEPVKSRRATPLN